MRKRRRHAGPGNQTERGGKGRSGWEKEGDGPAAGPCGEGREERALGLEWPMRERKRGPGMERGERSCWAGLGEEVGYPFLFLFFLLSFSTLKHSNNPI
jgi:hypothetical protein